ncbi:MAG: hypothetical protein ABIS06_16510 [Vicinamibacterales bacterium]
MIIGLAPSDLTIRLPAIGLRVVFAMTPRLNTRRLLGPIGYMPPAEYEARYYQQAAVA